MDDTASGVLDLRLLAVLEELATANRVEQVVEVVTQRVAPALGAARCALAVVSVDGRRLRWLAGASPAADRSMSVEESHPLVDAACRGQEQWFVAGAARHAAYPPLAADADADSDGAWAYLPLSAASSGRRGGLELGFAEQRAREPALRARACTVATHVGIAIDRTWVVGGLEEALRITDEVVGILGHDLRNPLHAVILAIESMLADPGCDPWVRSLLRIRNSAERMSRLVAQLLDLAKVRLGGGLRVEPLAMDLAELVRQHVDEAQPGAEQPIEVEVRGDAAGTWDRDRLAQAVANLLDNAIQHGHRDSPIQVEIDGTHDEVLLSVWNGGAIPADILPVVFEPFRGRRDGRGLGLGLYIARAVVVAHGGDFTVRSSLLGGTTFLISLPRARSLP